MFASNLVRQLDQVLHRLVKLRPKRILPRPSDVRQRRRQCHVAAAAVAAAAMLVVREPWWLAMCVRAHRAATGGAGGAMAGR